MNNQALHGISAHPCALTFLEGKTMSNDITETTVPSTENERNFGLQPTRRRRPSVNITPAERLGRIAIGLATIVVGAILLASASSAIAVIFEVLLVAAGADLVVTGAMGHCPLYAKLGHVPTSLRKSS